MKQWMGVSLITVLVLALSACGGQAGTDKAGSSEGAKAAPAAPMATDAPPEGSSPAAAMKEAADAAAAKAAAPPAAATGDAPVEAAASDVPAAPAASGIVGTIWKVGEFTIKFEADGVIRVKGGSVPAILPNGLEGSYMLKDDGSLELNAGGSSFSGSFSDGKLTVDGTAATNLTEF